LLTELKEYAELVTSSVAIFSMYTGEFAAA
jgi:hypothetical protein